MSRKVAYCGILVALAMIFSYVEALIPVNFGVPGMKLGIANLVVVTGFYFLKPQEVLMVSFIRILLMGFMFGNGMSLIYSISGGLLSFGVMYLIKKTGGFSIIGMSIAGGIGHNVGQILAAVWMVQNINLIYYLPALLVAGAVTGTWIGILSQRILSAIKSGSRMANVQN